MTRLIDAEALKEAFENTFYEDYDDEIRTEKLIDNAPTVDTGDSKYLEERDADAWESGYIQGLSEQRPHGEWIPVSERLPEKNGYYLVTRKGFSIKNHVKRVGYDANTKRWSEGSIIAWQPLPEPYKEGGVE